MEKASTDPSIRRLYNYQRFNADWLEDMLTENRIHFSDPTNFNDPWDCCPKFEMDTILNTERLGLWESFLLTDAEQVVGKAVLDRIERMGLLSQIEFLEDILKPLARHAREITVRNWRIYCLTPDPASTLMWSHYANRHNGLCLEFDAADPLIGGAYKVEYSDKLLPITSEALADLRLLARRSTLTKSEDWEYEREYRILCRTGEWDQQQTLILRKTRGDYLEIQPDAILRVIVGAKGKFDDVKKIVERCRPGLKVHQATLAENRYQVIIPPEHWT